MSKDNIFDISVIANKFNMRKKCLSGKPVLISTASWFNFGEGEDGDEVVAHPGEYWMKSSFSTQDPWKKVCIVKGRSKLSPADINLPIMYSSGHPITHPLVIYLKLCQPHCSVLCAVK